MRSSSGKRGKAALSAAMLTVFVIIPCAGVVGVVALVSGDHDRSGSVQPISGLPAYVPTERDPGFLDHLAVRGAARSLSGGQQSAIGHMVCSDMVANPDRTMAQELAIVDRYTGDHDASVILADAALSHLCPEVSK